MKLSRAVYCRHVLVDTGDRFVPGQHADSLHMSLLYLLTLLVLPAQAPTSLQAALTCKCEGLPAPSELPLKPNLPCARLTLPS